MHYFSRLENTIKSNWDGIALANFRGETFTFGELAKQIARFHVFFETVGLKKGDKVITAGGIYAVVKEVKPGEPTILIQVDGDVTLRIDKNMVVADNSQLQK